MNTNGTGGGDTRGREHWGRPPLAGSERQPGHPKRGHRGPSTGCPAQKDEGSTLLAPGGPSARSGCAGSSHHGASPGWKVQEGYAPPSAVPWP